MSKIKSELITQNTKIWNKPNENPKIELIRAQLQSDILRILGPCALQDETQATKLLAILSGNADLLRAPVLKPRTNRFNADGNMGYTGIGIEQGLEIYKHLNEQNTGVGIATEVMSAQHLRSLGSEIELAWIGSRTQDQYLLESIGEAAVEMQVPIMIKNAMIPDLEFDIGRINNVIWGINQASKKLNLPPVPVMVCLRGTNPGHLQSNYRNIPNWEAIDALKDAFPGLPIIIDPSHILKKNVMSPQSVLELLINAFNRPSGHKPNGYIVEVHHTEHPSVTDPGVEVNALLELLAQTNLLQNSPHREE